jgi:hypothetical protein
LLFMACLLSLEVISCKSGLSAGDQCETSAMRAAAKASNGRNFNEERILSVKHRLLIFFCNGSVVVHGVPPFFCSK